MRHRTIGAECFRQFAGKMQGKCVGFIEETKKVGVESTMEGNSLLSHFNTFTFLYTLCDP